MTPRRAAQLLVILPLLAVAAVDAQADRWWAHVRVLADDALEGRDNGQRRLTASGKILPSTRS